MDSGGTKRSSSESFFPASVPDPEPTGQSESEGNPADIDGKEETTPYDGQKEIVKALEVLERDSVAIAGSFTSLFSSLRLVLSQVTSTTVDHMNCFSDAAGGLQECVLDAATKGNRYINSCLRLNEGMKGIENLASQLEFRNVAIQWDTLVCSVGFISLTYSLRQVLHSEKLIHMHILFGLAYAVWRSFVHSLDLYKKNPPEECRCIGL